MRKENFQKTQDFFPMVQKKLLMLLKVIYLRWKLWVTTLVKKTHQPHQNTNTKTNSRNRNQKLSPKQMLEALPKALAQVKVGNTTENLLNKIRQIILYLYHVKEITRNLYHIINLVEL